jgi:hypothetical protein
MPALPVVAWRDDGATRSGSTSTAYRVVTDETKRGMPKAAVEAYTDALVRLEDAQAYAAQQVREALERAVQACRGERRNSEGHPTERAYNMAISHCVAAIRTLPAEIQPPQKAGTD